MVQWADFWASSDCVELCLDRLSSLPLLHVTDINSILDLPQGIQDLPSFSKVKGACSQCLMREYSSSGTANDKQQLGSFCSLSLAAVKVFAESAVTGETRAVLLASWYVEAAKKGCNTADLQQLLQEVTVEDGNLLTKQHDPKLLDVCSKWLLHHYHDVYKVIVDGVLLKSFKGLSFSAVKVWAGLDALNVHNENDVAVLLTLWCDGRSLTGSEKDELSSLLRVSRLSYSFLSYQLPELKWFVYPAGCDASVLSSALIIDGGLSCIGAKLPAVWDAPVGRGMLINAAERCMITHGFPKTEVAGMIEKALQDGVTGNLYSPCFCYGGFYWRLSLQLHMPSRTLGAYLYSANNGPLLAPRGVKSKFSFYHRQQNGNSMLKGRECQQWFRGASGYGFLDLFKLVTGPAEDVKKLLYDGKLVLKCCMVEVK